MHFDYLFNSRIRNQPTGKAHLIIENVYGEKTQILQDTFFSLVTTLFLNRK